MAIGIKRLARMPPELLSLKILMMPGVGLLMIVVRESKRKRPLVSKGIMPRVEKVKNELTP